MKIKQVLIGACVVAVSGIANGAPPVETDAEGYLNRGKQLYEIQNYTGAIDQLSHVKNMGCNAVLQEEADFYLAMSQFNSGSEDAIVLLKRFIGKYPQSFHVPYAQMAIGDKFFYSGKYGEAVKQYSVIGDSELNGAEREDLLYRKAYSELRLGEYDKAENYFKRLGYISSRYRKASMFYQGYIDYSKGDYDSALDKFDKVGKDGELGYNAQYYTTQIYFTRSEYDNVVKTGGKLLYENNNSEFAAELNRLIGESFFQIGNDREAKKYLTEYFAKCDEGTEPMRSAYYIMGVLNQRSRDIDGVIEYMSHVIGEDDAMTQSAYLYTGQAYIAKGNNTSAMMAFEKAMQMPFDRNVQETAFYNYAVAQSKGSRTPFSRSIDHFEEFLNKYPTSRYTDDVETYLVNAYISGSDYEKALISISHIEKPSENVLKAKQYVLYNLGINNYSNGNYENALNCFTEARTLGNYRNSIKENCELWLGDCHYKKGKYTAAEKSYRNYLRYVRQSDANYALANYDLGYALFQQRKYADARSAFKKAINSREGLKVANKADAYNRIGDTYYYGKSFVAASDNYKKAREINPAASDYALYQEAIMDGLQKNYSTKEKKLNQLLSEYPNSALRASAMLEKADAQNIQKKSGEAIKTLERVIKDFPEAPEARKAQLRLAITLKNTGEQARAIANYRKLVNKYPSSEEAQLAVEDLKVIYSENGQIDELQHFLANIPNAPKIDVNELDRLAFAAAENSYLGEREDITNMKKYLKKYPNGAYSVNANYYVAQYNFKQGEYDEALTQINDVLEKGADATFAEDAMAMKGAILMEKEQYKNALATYKALTKKATTSNNRILSQLGVMRASEKLGKHGDVVEAADNLLAAGGLSEDEEREVRYMRAEANLALNKGGEAEADLKELSKSVRDIYGAKAAYKLAEYYYGRDNLKKAEKTLNAFIEAGTPHEYWLARGFILLSDVFVKQNKEFEAREYLESLKSNYPGTESDIFKMIDQRLEKLKK